MLTKNIFNIPQIALSQITSSLEMIKLYSKRKKFLFITSLSAFWNKNLYVMGPTRLLILRIHALYQNGFVKCFLHFTVLRQIM